jgi:hypothetical protein
MQLLLIELFRKLNLFQRIKTVKPINGQLSIKKFPDVETAHDKQTCSCRWKIVSDP